MTSKAQPPALVPFDGARIPQSLKDMPRWAPWRAIWSEKKQKYDKVPYRADVPAIGLSTKDPERWFTYEAALKAFNQQPGRFAGLGFCMTHATDLVGVDLDKCIADGVVAEWAQKIIYELDSYTEISPSGKGLRIFLKGRIETDWNNHEVGIEIYAGHAARFLTITGAHLNTTPPDVRTEGTRGYLAELSLQYAKERTNTVVIDADMPDILDDLALPALEDLTLPDEVAQFLETGEHDGDGSAVLNLSGISLYANGLDDAAVFSFLANNEHAMGVSLSHRRDDHDRALSYLWQHHCMQAKAKGVAKLATIDDFEDLTPKDAEGKPVPVTKRVKPRIQKVGEFLDAPELTWLIPEVLPKADLATVYGASGSGKTFFVLDMLCALATGREWRGHTLDPIPVLYVCAEGSHGFRQRLKAYNAYYGLDLNDFPFYVLNDAPNFTQVGNIKNLIKDMQSLPEKIVLVAVDTWAQVTAGADENSGKDMGQALAHCSAITSAMGSMVMLVAHTGKDAAKGVRGWSGVKGALDVEIEVEKLTDKSRAATITKLKDGPGENRQYGFHLVSVDLGKDSKGNPITSCVVGVDGEVVRPTKRVKLGVMEQRIMDTANDLLDLAGTATTAALIDAVIERTPRGTAVRDQRRGQVSDTLKVLEEKEMISTAGGQITLPSGERA